MIQELFLDRETLHAFLKKQPSPKGRLSHFV